MMRNKIAQLIDAVASKSESWFEERGIDALYKGDYCVLNYGITDNVNDFNTLTRGMVIDTVSRQPVCFPFERFFNYGECRGERETNINISNAYILEKLDGSLLNVWHTHERCTSEKAHCTMHFSTRRMICDHQPDYLARMNAFDGKTFSLMQKLENFIHTQLHFPHSEDADCFKHTFIFEAIWCERPVITTYKTDDIGLYLIGARNMHTFEEENEDILDEIAQKINAKRPKLFNPERDYQAIISSFEKFDSDFEGFVLRDRVSGIRVKVKQETYVKRHRLLGKTSYKNLLPLYFTGERDEIVSYFPETEAKFITIDTAVKSIAKYTVETLCELRNQGLGSHNRKAYAMAVLPKHKHISSLLFTMIDADTNHINHCETFIRAHLQVQHSRVQLALLHLEDDEELNSVVNE